MFSEWVSVLDAADTGEKAGFIKTRRGLVVRET